MIAQTTPGGRKPKYYDEIYEHANEIRSYFERIGFKRGLAIIDYIMAIRIIKFKKMIQFKNLIKSSADFFFHQSDLDGIKQCVKMANRVLKAQSGQDIEKIQSNC